MARTNINDALATYEEAKQLRRDKEQQFRMNSAYCLPRDYPRWLNSESGSMGTSRQGDAEMRARFAFDNTGVRAVPTYQAICKRLINPDNIKYHSLDAEDPELAKIPDVRVFFSALTDRLFRMRRSHHARHGTAQGEMYASIGVYGTGPKALTWRSEGNESGFLYKAWPLYDIFILVDDEGKVTDVFRRFRLNRRQWKLRWPNDPLPTALKNAKDSDQNTTVECVHWVSKRRSDYDPQALDSKRHPWLSAYMCKDDQCYIGDEQGFVSCPYMMASTMTTAGDPYGYSPAELAFPALGGANAVKKTYLKMGHKAVSPPLLANDDSALSGRIDVRPDRITYGGLNASGQQLVQPMQSGSNFQVAENLLVDERKDIDAAFLVNLFQILAEQPEMTAAELYERVAEKAALFAPTMAALQEMDQGPQIEREIALLAEHGKLPEMPPELIEAGGRYKVDYVNPMSKALYAPEIAGFMRWSEMAINAANVTQDPSPTDWIEWDSAMPDIGYKMDVRPDWVSTPEKVAAKRDARSQQQQRQQMVDAAPAMASAAATMQKQGGKPANAA